LIPLEDELGFIESYFFLLEIRYDKNIRLQLSLGDELRSVMIPPCAMQILIENAIKHNQFSDKYPLDIEIRMNGEYIKVSNTIRLKSYPHNSTNTGLKNLALRFRLICQREILIENNNDNFTVKLPLIHETKKVSHDQCNHY
jgi:LytS/YehU family sensor histidine kinase